MLLRRKSIEEIILDISDIARNLDNYLRKEPVKDNTKLLKFFERISLTEQEELDRVRQEIGSDELVNMCIEAIELSRQATEDVKRSDYQKAIEAVDKILDIEKFLELKIQKYDLNIYKKGSFKGAGAFAEAWYVKDNPNLILRISTDKRTKLKEYIDIFVQHRQIPEGTNVARILGVGMYGKAGKQIPAMLMELAPGEPLHTNFGNKKYKAWKNNLIRLANAPQEHYNKLIKDVASLRLLNIKMDLASPKNILYDEQTGFHLIDLGKLDLDRSFFGRIKKIYQRMSPDEKERNSDCLPIAFIPREDSTDELVTHITSDDMKNIDMILEKLKIAGYRPSTPLDKDLYADLLSRIDKLKSYVKPALEPTISR